MELGMIGLGRMGSTMVRRLLDGSRHVVVYDRVKKVVEAMVGQGAVGATSIAELVQKLTKPCGVNLSQPVPQDDGSSRQAVTVRI
jgi:6-phosphogluconate dehydrogenase